MHQNFARVNVDTRKYIKFTQLAQKYLRELGENIVFLSFLGRNDFY
jgi:hypothetical protein